MGSASITIAVNGKWNGQGALDSATRALQGLGTAASGSARQVSSALESQQKKYERLSRLAASTSKSTSAEIAAVGTSMVIAGGRIYGVGKSISEAGELLTKTVTGPLMSFGSYSGRAAIEFDTAMANVRKVTDMTDGELQKLADSALALSQTQPVTADTILNIEALGAQFGIADDQLENFAKTVSGLDIATNMNSEQAATQLAQFKNIVGMADDEMQNYGSTIVWLGNNFATTESDISNMAARFASAGHQANLSSAEILGLSAAMSSLGIRSEMGGSALSQVFVQISKAVSSGGEALEAFASASNMSAEEFARAWKSNAAGAFTALLQGIHDSSEAGKDMNVTLSEMGITQIRASDTMRRMAGSVDLVKSAIEGSNSAWSENVALQNEVDQRNESMESRLQVLQNRIEAVAIKVGVPLVNAVISATDAASPLLETVSDAAEAFSDADEETQRLAVGLAALAAAGGPVLKVGGSLVQMLGGTVTSLGNLTQDAAVYADALRTVDGAQMRTYKSAETTATKLGLMGNATIQAAGSVDTYISVWEEWIDNQKLAQNSATKSATLYKKAEDTMSKLSGTTGKQTAKLKEQAAAYLISAQSAQKQADSAKQAASVAQKQLSAWQAQGAAMKGVAGAATSAVKGIGSYAAAVVAANAPMIAFTAAAAALSAGIGYLVKKHDEEVQATERANERNRTFAQIAREARGAATSQAEGVQALADTIRDGSDSLKEWHQSVFDSQKSLYATIATAEDYQRVIDGLANKGIPLTAHEQAQLTAAVDGYNQVTGGSIEITDKQNGVLSVSTEELDRNTEAWKRNVQSQALQEQAVEAQKRYNEQLANQRSAHKELSAAKNELAAAEKALAGESQWMADGTLNAEWQKHNYEVKKAKERVGEATDAYKEAKGTANSYKESLDEIGYAQTALSEAVAPFADAINSMAEQAPALSEALDCTGVSIDELAVKLQEAGVSVETLSQVGAENMAALATEFGGDVDAMVWALQNYNSVPITDKDGSVTVDDAQLRDASGRIAVWNGQELVYKDTDVKVDDGELRDAQGAVYTWNGSKLVNKSVSATASGNVVTGEAKRKSDEAKRSFDALPQHKNTELTATDNASGTVKSVLGWLSSIPRSITTFVNTVTGSKRAAGGIRHADGGIRYHAPGGIVNAPVTGYPLDLVGEAGAEAIVPLTNRRYAMPFVRMIADETAKAMAPMSAHGLRAGDDAHPVNVVNNYNLSIDGVHVEGSGKAQAALRALVDEFNLTAEMGVV